MPDKTKIYDITYDDVNEWDKPFMPDFVESYSWDNAVEDIRRVMQLVSADDLKAALETLKAGKINGKISSVDLVPIYGEYGPCGCLIATIGHIQDQPEPPVHLARPTPYNDWELFERKYGMVHDMMTPFQVWLFGVHPGSTPENNVIAAAFAAELEAMIAERQKAI